MAKRAGSRSHATSPTISGWIRVPFLLMHFPLGSTDPSDARYRNLLTIRRTNRSYSTECLPREYLGLAIRNKSQHLSNGSQNQNGISRPKLTLNILANTPSLQFILTFLPITNKIIIILTLKQLGKITDEFLTQLDG